MRTFTPKGAFFLQQSYQDFKQKQISLVLCPGYFFFEYNLTDGGLTSMLV
jgi:hypothetical protein